MKTLREAKVGETLRVVKPQRLRARSSAASWTWASQRASSSTSARSRLLETLSKPPSAATNSPSAAPTPRMIEVE